jgi:conjugative transfer region protein TrbK
MNTKTAEQIPTLAAVLLVVLTVAACAIRLRGDEVPANTAAASEVAPNTLTAKLRECRSVTDLQNDALTECRKLSLFVARKDASRLPAGYPSIQPSGKE